MYNSELLKYCSKLLVPIDACGNVNLPVHFVFIVVAIKNYLFFTLKYAEVTI